MSPIEIFNRPIICCEFKCVCSNVIYYYYYAAHTKSLICSNDSCWSCKLKSKHPLFMWILLHLFYMWNKILRSKSIKIDIYMTFKSFYFRNGVSEWMFSHSGPLSNHISYAWKFHWFVFQPLCHSSSISLCEEFE